MYALLRQMDTHRILALVIRTYEIISTQMKVCAEFISYGAFMVTSQRRQARIYKEDCMYFKRTRTHQIPNSDISIPLEMKKGIVVSQQQ